MYSVYTISRQFGSSGSSFAKLLSIKSGYTLVWREVINQAAIQLGSPEHALAMIDEFNLLDFSPDQSLNFAYIESIQSVMNEIARKGKQIIVGRASQIILSDHPDVFRIRIIASKNTRIQNVCKSKNVHPEAAAALIEQSDLSRENYLRKYYHVDWNDPSLYDVTINTDHIMLADAVNWVLSFPEK